MVKLLLLTLALAAPAELAAQTAPAPPPATQAKPPAPKPPTPRPPAAASTATVTLTLSVTTAGGDPLPGVKVTAIGSVEREATSIANGTVRLAGLRAGTYRLRFERDGYYTFEKEVSWRAGQALPDVSVALNEAPPPPATPPPPPPPPSEVAMPPAGAPKTMALPDFIEKNFITAREGHKENLVGCSGVGQAMLWQVREPWGGREHASADAMLYFIGGEGTLKVGSLDVNVAAGSFAVVPRGTAYGFTRRGRNPLIILGVLTGAPCAAN